MEETSIYQMFDIIAQSGVGYSGNIGLLYVQLILSLFVETKFLVASMRKRPPMVQISVLMIPIILVVTYAIVGGIFFSAFLGEGPSRGEMVELILVTLTEQSISTMLTAMAIFFLLMLAYSIAYRLKPLQWLMTFGVETLAALSLLALYGGLLVEDFPYTILDLCETSIFLARWPIYGYFMVLFKCCILVMALFLGILLHERKEKPISEEEQYSDWHQYYERKTLGYLTKNFVLIGGAFLFFSVAAEVFLWYGIKREATVWDASSIPTLIFSVALFATPGAIGAGLFYRALRPRTCVAYRQLLAMGDRDRVLQLFCEEIVDGNQPNTDLWSSKMEMQTAHFRYWQQGVKPRVEWRGKGLEKGSN